MLAQETTTPNDQQQSDEEYYSPSFLEAEDEDEYEDFDLRPQQFARRRQCRVLTTLLGILVLAGMGTGTYFALSRNSSVSMRMVQAAAPQSTAAAAASNSTAASDGSSSSSSSPNTSTASDGITLEVVAMHKSADDCWHAIQGTVYDLTSYAPGKQEQLIVSMLVRCSFWCFHSMLIR